MKEESTLSVSNIQFQTTLIKLIINEDLKMKLLKIKRKIKLVWKLNKRRRINDGDIPYSVENNCEEDYREANKIINSKIGGDGKFNSFIFNNKIEFYGEDQPFEFGIKEGMIN